MEGRGAGCLSYIKLPSVEDTRMVRELKWMGSSKFIFCPFVARVHVSLWLDPGRLRLRLLPLRSSRIAQAPACLLLRVLLRVAVRWQRACRVDSPMAHSANFEVRLVVTKELFPVFYALSNKTMVRDEPP
jgi:hypothetical protein